MRQRIKAVTSRVSLLTLTYLAGAALISFGSSLVYMPAGLIAGGTLLIVLVFDADGE